MKKAISLFLGAIMCLTIFTLSTPVAFAATYSGTCGSGITWSLNTSDGTLTVSGSGQMTDYSLSAAPGWDKYQNYIKSVVFDDGVTYVGDYAFYNGGNGYKYKKLVSVDFGSVESIGDYAFRGCAALSEITGCENVTKIYSNAFRGCTALTDFTFSNINEICEGAFCGAGLENITLPETIRTVRSSAFEGCKDAQTITIPRMISIIKDRAFADCSNVSYITYEAAAVSTLGMGVFNGTGKDSGMTLEIGTYVSVIPDGLFSSCYNLTEITGGDRVSTIGKEAFAHTGITHFEVNSVLATLGNSAFAGCDALTSFTANGDNECFSADSTGVLLDKIGKHIVVYPAGKTAQSYTVPSDVLSVGDDSFRETKYLKNFYAGDNITKIPERCFFGSDSLETVTLGAGTVSVDTYAFAGCDNLESVTMNAVTQLNNYAFAECDSLSALPSMSSVKTIGDFAFYDCDGLLSVSIPAGVTSIGKYAFFNCKNITTVVIPSTTKTIMEGAFSDCLSLTSLTLNNGVTTIQKNAFVDCSSLLSVTVPSSVTEIGQTAFGFAYATGSAMSKISGFVLHGGANTAAQTYANDYTITFQANADTSEDITINEDGTVAPADTAEEIDPMFTFDAFDSFGSIAEFFMNFDYLKIISRVVNFIVNVVNRVRGILCA